MFALNMTVMALELAIEDRDYENIALQTYEQFLFYPPELLHSKRFTGMNTKRILLPLFFFDPPDESLIHFILE